MKGFKPVLQVDDDIESFSTAMCKAASLKQKMLLLVK